jgi:hypothetical protein
MNKLTLLASAAALAATFAGGYQVANWQNDSHALTAERAAQQAIDASMNRESQIAAHIEERLGELKASERVIDRGIIREIQNPIYHRVCLEPNVIRLLNSAADGTAPTELTNPLP